MNLTKSTPKNQTEDLNQKIVRLENLVAELRAERSENSPTRARSESQTKAQALLDSEEILRGIMDNVEDAVMTIDLSGTLLSFNPSAERMFGYTAEEALGQPVEMLMPKAHQTKHGDYVRSYEQTGESQILGKGPRELEGLRKDGTRFPLDLSIAEMHAGGLRRFVGTIRDISERKKAERAFRENARELDTIYHTAGVGILTSGPEGQCIRCNRKFEELLGYSEAELKTKNILQLSQPDHIEEDRRLRREVYDGRRHGYQMDKQFIRRDGTSVWVGATIVGLKDADGKVIATIGIAEDITERKRAEAALAESERHYRSLFETSKDGILISDVDGNIQDANPAILAMLGYGLDEICRKTVEEITPPEWRNFTTEARDNLRFGPRDEYEKEYLHRDGTAIPVTVHVWRVDQEQSRIMAIIRDISERKQVEEQLRQAQKMEAIGQLTGGIAHDFNNLLTVISGNLEMISDELDGNATLSNMAASAIRAAERGASLTQRLLAFSRKQMLLPRTIAIDQLLTEMTDLLTRTLGATIAIEVTHLDGSLTCQADASQLENAILNLAINARDAMPDGGRLIIFSRRATVDEAAAAKLEDMPTGDYALLEVTDTGCGIGPEELERVFDPFFTTKDVGKGSGLGLSMVYGFAKQSGGQAVIQSEPGRGTTVSIYLPRPASQ